jgi:hypothetical protein
MNIKTAAASALAALVVMSSAPTFAQSAPRAVENAPVNSGVQTPIDDLNLRKSAIPPLLIDAIEQPYSLQGLRQCSQLVTAVEELNGLLGKDLDLPQESGSRLTVNDVADFAASSLIPFRGLIREVTGANGRQRQLQEAVLAGFARRSFLKGVGEIRGCPYPARVATPRIIAQQAALTSANLEALCGPLPGGAQRSKAEERRNRRQCAEYRRMKTQDSSAGRSSSK